MANHATENLGGQQQSLKKYNFIMYGYFLSQVYDKYWSRFAKRMAPAIYTYYKNEPVSNQNKNLLDLCCGTGQLACYFYQRGFNIVCVDRSIHMLRHAQKNIQKVRGAAAAHFINADMVSLSTSTHFGIAVCTCDSINYLSTKKSLLRSFQRIHSSLVSGGIFVFDLQTPQSINKKSKGIEIIDDGEMYIINQQEFNGGNIGHINITGFIRDGSGLFHRFDEKFNNRAFELQVVQSCLQDVGFRKIILTDGTLRRRIADSENVEWVQVVAKKY